MTNQELYSQLAAGIKAAQVGDLAQAVTMLAQVVRSDPSSEMGWFWLGKCVPEPERKVYCLRRAIALDPTNVEFQRELARLEMAPLPEPIGLIPVERPVSQVPPIVPATVQQQREFQQVTRSEKSEPQLLHTTQPSRPVVAAPAGKKKPTRPSYMFYGLYGCSALIGLLSIAILLVMFLNLNKVEESRLPIPSVTTIVRVNLTDYPMPSPFPSPTTSPTPTKVLFTRTPMVTPTANKSDKVLYSQAKQQHDRAIHETYEGNFYDLIAKAVENIDLAIEMKPDEGEYYSLRYEIYAALAGNADYRSEYRYYQEIALENLRTAVALGTSDRYLERWIPLFLFSLGRCQEGMQELERIKTERGASAPPSVAMLNFEAHGYLCLGQFEKALEYVDRGLEIENIREHRWLRTMILYHLGRRNDALQVLNELIDECPNYCGNRYYLRSVIYFDLGMKDLAKRDLWTGSGNTWAQTGLNSYMQARFALDDGRREEAIYYFQEALDSIFWYHEALLPKIRAELVRLGVQPLPEEPFPYVHITPLPTLIPRPVAATPQPPLSGYPTPSSPIVVQIENGTGFLNEESFKHYPVYLFQPGTSPAIQAIRSMILHFSRPGHNGQTPFPLFLWNYQNGEWVMFWPVWGANEIPEPGRFVDKEGKFYLAIRCPGNMRCTIQNIQTTLEFTSQDGVESILGYQK